MWQFKMAACSSKAAWVTMAKLIFFFQTPQGFEYNHGSFQQFDYNHGGEGYGYHDTVSIIFVSFCEMNKVTIGYDIMK